MSRPALLLAATLAAGCITACSSSAGSSSAGPTAAVGRVPSRETAAVTVTVSTTRACPASLGHAQDVTRQPGLPRNRLLPTGLPSRGLICEYRAADNSTNGRLLHSVPLDVARARRLARAVERVSLRPAKGAFSCPAGFRGSETVIAFAYAGRHDVDLWYSTTGCRTLDNGDVLAFQGANPSFYTGFETTFDALVPPPAP